MTKSVAKDPLIFLINLCYFLFKQVRRKSSHQILSIYSHLLLILSLESLVLWIVFTLVYPNHGREGNPLWSWANQKPEIFQNVLMQKRYSWPFFPLGSIPVFYYLRCDRVPPCVWTLPGWKRELLYIRNMHLCGQTYIQVLRLKALKQE